MTIWIVTMYIIMDNNICHSFLKSTDFIASVSVLYTVDIVQIIAGFGVWYTLNILNYFSLFVSFKLRLLIFVVFKSIRDRYI